MSDGSWNCAASPQQCSDDAWVFYDDLSEYAYLDNDSFIDRESGFYGLWYRPEYTRAAFVEKLKAVQQVQWMNVCLGVHKCDLCPEGVAPEGNGEVRIPGEPGIAYAAPFLITHYITAHDYRPPDVLFPWVPDGAERMLE